jgi:hypothetical protein
MKKIIALLVVTLAFSLGANAQQKREAHAVQMSSLDANKQEKIKQAAIADANELGKAVKLADKDKEMYISLFETKYRMYASTNNEPERNAYVADIIERKLSAGLSADDLKKVNNTPGLMKRLTGK